MNEKIFITLGSQKFQFNRLLIAVDKLCEKKGDFWRRCICTDWLQ